MMDRLLENDTVLKILSLLVAIFVWVDVNGGASQLVQRKLGPEALSWSVPATRNLTVLSIRPSTVYVWIQGPPNTTTNATAVGAWVDLSKLTAPGTYTLPVEASVPQGSTLVEVQPKYVVVTVDSVITRRFHVLLKPVGTPPPGYGVVAVGTPPHPAAVTGPGHLVKQVAAVEGKLDVAGNTTSFSEQVILFPVNAKGQVVPDLQVSPEVVTVPVTVLPEKTVPVVVHYTGQPAAGLTVTGIQVSPGQVTVAGSAAALAGIAAIDTKSVNLAGQDKTFTVRAHLVVPPGVEVVNPTTVEVTIGIGS
jgi:YbbR domain-containing protein